MPPAAPDKCDADAYSALPPLREAYRAACRAADAAGSTESLLDAENAAWRAYWSALCRWRDYQQEVYQATGHYPGPQEV